MVKITEKGTGINGLSHGLSNLVYLYLLFFLVQYVIIKCNIRG